ncbi:MAG: alpha/beta fold hydrolase [Pseudomonadota bacterium]
MGHVGYRTGIEADTDRLDWNGTGERPLAWAAWYPISPEASVGNRPTGQFFDLGAVEANAELSADQPFPVVLLSHGTGGTPEGLGWLARLLAERGYVVIGAYHHGNTGREAYSAEGFLCWWERATDLSNLLSFLSTYGPFASRLDLSRVHTIGFSLGGYTALALAGARTSVERYLAWSSRSPDLAHGHREFPGVAGRIPDLLESSEVFRRSWERRGDSFRDKRIRSVVAIAPAPTVRAFDEGSLKSILLPVTLISGEADTEAPPRDCADWMASINSGFDRFSLGENVGHYTFLGHPAGRVTPEHAFLFEDLEGVDRDEVHHKAGEIVLTALRNAE